MHPYHRRFLYSQVFVLFVVVLLLAFFPQCNVAVFPLLSVFFLLEIGVLETQRKEIPEAMRYRKSCAFALIDVLSVIIFLILFVLYGLVFFDHNVEFSYSRSVVVFSYIGFRKLYILRNYSYEKRSVFPSQKILSK